MTPHLSVLLHGNADLAATLDALTAQSRPADEVLLFHEGPPPEALRRFRGELRVLDPDQWDRAATLARGETCLFLQAGDLLLPEALATFSAMLETHPTAALAACRVVTYAEDPDAYRYDNDTWVAENGYHEPMAIARALCGRAFSKGLVLYRRAAVTALAPEPMGENLRPWWRLYAGAFTHGMVYHNGLLGKQPNPPLPANTVTESELLGLLDFLTRPDQGPLAACFARSGVLGMLGMGLAEAVLERPERWQAPVMALIQQNLFNWSQNNERLRLQSFRCLNRTLREDLLPRAEKALALCHSRNYRRVAFFGAGGHTRFLLEIWRESRGPAITHILTSQAGSEPACDGVPQIALADFDPEQVDAVVLSSQSYEAEMSRSLARVAPDLPCLALWQPDKYSRPL